MIGGRFSYHFCVSRRSTHNLQFLCYCQTIGMGWRPGSAWRRGRSCPERKDRRWCGVTLKREDFSIYQQIRDYLRDRKHEQTRVHIQKGKPSAKLVSDKYFKKQWRLSHDRAAIGKLISMLSLRPNRQASDLCVPFQLLWRCTQSAWQHLHDGSPLICTGKHSIPRRQTDSAPPWNISQSHFEHVQIIR